MQSLEQCGGKCAMNEFLGPEFGGRMVRVLNDCIKAAKEAPEKNKKGNVNIPALREARLCSKSLRRAELTAKELEAQLLYAHAVVDCFRRAGNPTLKLLVE